MIIKITEWALKNRMGYMLSNVFRVIITSHHITWGLGRVGGGRSCGRGGCGGGSGGITLPGGCVGLVGVGPVDEGVASLAAASLAKPFLTTSAAVVPHLPAVSG